MEWHYWLKKIAERSRTLLRSEHHTGLLKKMQLITVLSYFLHDKSTTLYLTHLDISEYIPICDKLYFRYLAKRESIHVLLMIKILEPVHWNTKNRKLNLRLNCDTFNKFVSKNQQIRSHVNLRGVNIWIFQYYLIYIHICMCTKITCNLHWRI